MLGLQKLFYLFSPKDLYILHEILLSSNVNRD